MEDDPKLNQSICTYLNDSGFHAKGCLNANSAYDEMYNNLYELIISDIMMPEIDGFAFAQTVRQINKHIPILFMSARDDLPAKQKGFQLGIDDYMVKPLVLEELLMSGIHQGLLVLQEEHQWGGMIQTLIPSAYWMMVALGLTFYTRIQIRNNYEVPERRLSEATAKVANGDFSVYVPTVHSADQLDYLDQIILDFNKMVEELGSIETLKTDFFSNVSYEIKTPLAVIQNSAELLQGAHLTEEQRRECTDTILQTTKRLSNLITNMLKLNKLEKQVILPKPEPFDVCAQLCACVLQFEDAWEKKGIELEADIEDRAMICADEGLLEILWTNLLSNAVKFTPAGGTITIAQTSDQNEITISVTDTGCGLPGRPAAVCRRDASAPAQAVGKGEVGNQQAVGHWRCGGCVCCGRHGDRLFHQRRFPRTEPALYLIYKKGVLCMEKNNFIGYEYQDVTVKRSMASLYADSYQNFGWELDGTTEPVGKLDSVTMKFKRDRKLRNKAELTRLQRNFDACITETLSLEARNIVRLLWWPMSLASSARLLWPVLCLPSRPIASSPVFCWRSRRLSAGRCRISATERSPKRRLLRSHR